MMPRRQEGALLLIVSLLLATLAALAFGMNRAGGVELRSVNDDYEGRAAFYLAESGIAAARWSNQVSGCTVNPVPVTALGTGTFSATVGGKSDKLDIVASGSVNGAARTITRTKVTLYDLTETESTDLSDDAVDTTIAMLNILFPEEGNSTINLNAGFSNGLMSWDLDDLDDEVVVLSATLTLVQNGAGLARQVAIHRVTAPWDKNAMWSRPRATGSWTGGGAYTGVVLASASVAGGNGVWDLTGMVDGWASKRFANQGVLLRMVDAGQSASFYSREAASSRRPLLRVVTAEKC